MSIYIDCLYQFGSNILTGRRKKSQQYGCFQIYWKDKHRDATKLLLPRHFKRKLCTKILVSFHSSWSHFQVVLENPAWLRSSSNILVKPCDSSLAVPAKMILFVQDRNDPNLRQKPKLREIYYAVRTSSLVVYLNPLNCRIS